MDKFEWILEQITDLREWDVVALHNEYCESSNDMDSYIYDMSELDEIISGSASEILNQIDLDSFNLNDDYIQYGVHGFSSSDFPLSDGWIYPQDIARAINDGYFDASAYIDFDEFNDNIIQRLQSLGNADLVRVILQAQGYNPYFDESRNAWYDLDDDELIDDVDYIVYEDDLESLVDDYGEELVGLL